MSTILKIAGATLAVGVMAGCGGGGGGGGSSAAAGSTSPAVSAAALSTSNQTVASQDVASTALSLFGTSQSALGAVSANESVLYAEAFAQMSRLPAFIADAHANALAVGTVQSQSYNCPVSGSYSISVTDADGNAIASAGDSVSATYNACVSSSGTINGTLSFRIDALSGTYGSYPSTVGVTMSYGNLTLNASTYSVTINGALSVNGTLSGANAFTQTLSTHSLTASATYAGVTRSRSMLNYAASETRTADSSYTYLSTYAISGTLSSNGFAGGTQSVSFTTGTTPMVRRGIDVYPYTGSLLITGANNSALRLTALSNALVQESLDANGDGTFESNTTVTWTSLL